MKLIFMILFVLSLDLLCKERKDEDKEIKMKIKLFLQRLDFSLFFFFFTLKVNQTMNLRLLKQRVLKPRPKKWEGIK